MGLTPVYNLSFEKYYLICFFNIKSKCYDQVAGNRKFG